MKLTKKPHKLLQIALDDMKASLEQGYKIDMSQWGDGFKENGPKKCSVCFAGSVMLQRTQKTLDPNYFDCNSDYNTDQYNWLDKARSGIIKIKIGGWRPYKKIDKKAFFAQCEQLIELLEQFPVGTKIID